MIQRPFDAIAKADIDALIANAVSEFKTLEYKRKLPGTSEADKKEFLADVSSFANASGGDIIYGVTAAVDAQGKKTGAPEAVEPITETTPDAARLRLEEMIRNGISPRPRVHIKEVLGWGDDGRRFVILLRIPQSFASPHMVTFKGTSRFFSRNSAGKFQLDVGEIRAAFLATESQAERLKRFREDRLGRIVADETPVTLESPLRLVLHLIPVASFLNNERLDLTNETILSSRFRPIMVGNGFDYRPNLDGFLTWIPPTELTHGISYCQVFSHGAVEAVRAGSVLGGRTEDGRNAIYPAYEPHVVDALKRYLRGYQEIGVAPPVVVALSLLGCKGYCMWAGSWCQHQVLYSIDRDAVILPDVVIDSFDVDVPQVMKPIFDAVSNACGFRHSFNYDKTGNWQPRPT